MRHAFGAERSAACKTLIGLAFCALLAGLGVAMSQPPASPPSATPESSAAPTPAPAPFNLQPTGSYFALSVADIAATKKWYAETLGFQLVKEGKSPDGTVQFALLQMDGAVLELLQMAKAQPLPKAAPGVHEAFEVHGLFKAGFVVRDLQAVYRRIQAREIQVLYDMRDDKDFPLGSFIVADNEGNQIQFFGK
jgi:catechol 2,3-dioxygenase-like lactoylglutathione lyase family enzyme